MIFSPIESESVRPIESGQKSALVRRKCSNLWVGNSILDELAKQQALQVMSSPLKKTASVFISSWKIVILIKNTKFNEKLTRNRENQRKTYALTP